MALEKLEREICRRRREMKRKTNKHSFRCSHFMISKHTTRQILHRTSRFFCFVSKSLDRRALKLKKYATKLLNFRVKRLLRTIIIIWKKENYMKNVIYPIIPLRQLLSRCYVTITRRKPEMGQTRWLFFNYYLAT